MIRGVVLTVIIVEAQIDSPIMRQSLRAARETILTSEEVYSVNGEIEQLFWAEGEDLDRFAGALESDPTVTEQTVLAETNDKRLFRVRLSTAGRAAATSPIWREHNLALLDSRLTWEGWFVRLRFPDRADLAGFVDSCRERDLTISIERVFGGSELEEDGGWGLTGEQREALVAAAGSGYFEIPRRATLDDVAERLGVSAQAASERLRRGMSALVDSTLFRLGTKRP